MTAPTRRPIRSGEALAIAKGHYHQIGAEMWWDLGPASPKNETIGALTVVTVRGVLDHHEGFGESYDALVKRWTAACEGGQKVALRIDSPGGVVSGLDECVGEMREIAASAGALTVAFADGMATSAAYALACSCDEIVTSRAGILGSVGVISSMVSYAAANEAHGVQVVTITSGEAKADGHPDSPITDDAIERERARVETFADQFFDLVSEARALDADEIRGYQAGLFVGRDALRAGLVDAVMPWRELLVMLSAP